MKIAPQGAAAVNGHDAHKYEIHFGEHMARAVVGRQFCQCGCERSAWILALEFPEDSRSIPGSCRGSTGGYCPTCP